MHAKECIGFAQQIPMFFASTQHELVHSWSIWRKFPLIVVDLIFLSSYIYRTLQKTWKNQHNITLCEAVVFSSQLIYRVRLLLNFLHYLRNSIRITQFCQYATNYNFLSYFSPYRLSYNFAAARTRQIYMPISAVRTNLWNWIGEAIEF